MHMDYLCLFGDGVDISVGALTCLFLSVAIFKIHTVMHIFLKKNIESTMCCTQRKTTVKRTNRYH